jgi:hypothetical protein
MPCWNYLYCISTAGEQDIIPNKVKEIGDEEFYSTSL